jgi:hypothetical protein
VDSELQRPAGRLVRTGRVEALRRTSSIWHVHKISGNRYIQY